MVNLVLVHLGGLPLVMITVMLMRVTSLKGKMELMTLMIVTTMLMTEMNQTADDPEGGGRSALVIVDRASTNGPSQLSSLYVSQCLLMMRGAMSVLLLIRLFVSGLNAVCIRAELMTSLMDMR
jgi:hypothetical protein